MIGVLAIIALLASLILPRVTNAIADSKINNAVGVYENVQVAMTSHNAKYYPVNSLFGTNILTTPIANFDTTVLIPEGFLDKQFVVAVGNGSCIECVSAANCNHGSGFYLTGATNTPSTATMQYVVEAVITNVPALDAWSISLTVDGPNQTPTAPGQNDPAGRVAYTTTGSGSNNVYMFLSGQ